MNIQGLLLIVGLVLGPASVTTIAVTRTITRVGIQSAALLNHAVMPEFSMAAARKDRRALDQLFTINLLAYVALLAGAFVSLVVAGPFIISIWTRGAVSVDRSLVIAMAAAMVLQGLWHGTGNLLLSVSKQSSYAPHFFICNLCMIVACYFAAKAFGTYGAACALCLGELPMIFVVFRAMPMLGVSSASELLIQLPLTVKTLAAEVHRRLRVTARGRHGMNETARLRTKARKIGVVHPGTQHSWQTARALQDLETLAWYATSIFYVDSRWPYKATRYLPGRLKALALKELKRFYTPALKPENVYTFGASQWLMRLAARSGFRRLATWFMRSNDKSIAKPVRKLMVSRPVDGAWCYDLAALEIFRNAKKLGIATILDRTIGHPCSI